MTPEVTEALLLGGVTLAASIGGGVLGAVAALMVEEHQRDADRAALDATRIRQAGQPAPHRTPTHREDHL